jgi:hypothetical protein
MPQPSEYLRNIIAQNAAQTGGESMRSPIVRDLLGLRVGGLYGQPAATGDPVAQQPRRDTRQPDSIQDRLFRRMLVADDVGYGTPGEGVLSAGALRPEVRQLFEDRGGVVGVDITNMTPEERNALRVLLDPRYADRIDS